MEAGFERSVDLVSYRRYGSVEYESSGSDLRFSKYGKRNRKQTDLTEPICIQWDTCEDRISAE